MLALRPAENREGVRFSKSDTCSVATSNLTPVWETVRWMIRFLSRLGCVGRPGVLVYLFVVFACHGG